MNILKKSAFIITAALTMMSFTASCSKQEEVKPVKQGKKAIEGGKAKATFTADKINLRAVREGQFVNLSWSLGTIDEKIDQVFILRSPTGIDRKRKVAELDTKVTKFRDTLPDENVCWYWVRLSSADKNNQEIGPVKVEADKAGSAKYIKLDDKYKVVITRTDELATLKWEFPEGQYKEIEIARNARPVAEPFAGGGKSFLTTLSYKSQTTNALPNPNSEYWYWFRITLKSGEIIFRGPIKAEYAGP